MVSGCSRARQADMTSRTMRCAADRRQRPGISFRHPAQHLRLTLRAVDVALLDLADAMGQPGALVDQAQQFAIDRVYSVAQLASSMRVIGHYSALQWQVPNREHAFDAGDGIDGTPA
jgi:hypothetical protein